MNALKIKGPEFIKDLTPKQLNTLASDVRELLIESVSKTGGHLSSNLGVVELTIALHKNFESPTDKIIFDVGHQSYAHKILTGRASKMDTIRTFKGLSGFQKMSESKHDVFESGHASNSLSIAAGYAAAREIKGDDNHVVVVIGDAAIQGGMAFEALNNIGDQAKKVIVVLNDNEMSINEPTGMLSKVFKEARDEKDNRLETLFQSLGFIYDGPIDGHNFNDLNKALKKAKKATSPVLIHAKTIKGKGFAPAEGDKKGVWHGTGAFDKMSGQKKTLSSTISWSGVVKNWLEREMSMDKDISVVTPAMIAGSKLETIFELYPNRTFDTGITEAHAVTFAGGMALGGLKPYISIYSSFVQRAIDQMQQDVSRLKLPVTFIVDRSGLVGADGETHHGLYDSAIIYSTPNTVMAYPSNDKLIYAVLENFKTITDKTKFIKIERGSTVTAEEDITLKTGQWLVEHKPRGFKSTIVSYGPYYEKLKKHIIKNNLPIQMVNAVFVKPFDKEIVSKLITSKKTTYFVEPTTLSSSLYSYVKQFINDKGLFTPITFEDKWIQHGTVDQLLDANGLSIEKVFKKIK